MPTGQEAQYGGYLSFLFNDVPCLDIPSGAPTIPNLDAQYHGGMTLAQVIAAASVSMSEATGATLSLTTTATQTVKVDVTMEFAPGLLAQTVALNYDGVSKHSQSISLLSALALKTSVTLQCIISPGAQTKNLTVTTSGGTVTNVKWTIVKAG